MRAATVLLLALAAAPRMADAACPGRCPIPGGGAARTDCFFEFDGIVPNMPAAKPTYLQCTDGDPTCDVDATVDGACNFMVSVCLNNFDGRFPTCQPRKVYAFDIKGELPSRPNHDPQMQAIVAAATAPMPTDDSVCSEPRPWTIELKVQNGAPVRTIEMLKARGYGDVFGQRSRPDSDTIKVVCLPAPG
ncbi:MAG TPA: hypothetical protein VGR62_17755 [Candidatus Binatia bacterium]|jgi:hypothetical protein|nr:hypothetical protein [Candidatus Binatia bacterium]